MKKLSISVLLLVTSLNVQAKMDPTNPETYGFECSLRSGVHNIDVVSEKSTVRIEGSFKGREASVEAKGFICKGIAGNIGGDPSSEYILGNTLITAQGLEVTSGISPRSFSELTYKNGKEIVDCVCDITEK